MDFIHFFGTTGDKDVFFNNIRSAGGLYFNIDDTKFIIDPGVNTFYPYINQYQDKLDGIVLSHVHIDHSNDLNIFVELMTKGGKDKRGTLIVPNQAVENKVLQSYVREFPKSMYIIKPSTIYQIKNIEIKSSIEHRHGVETYGFRIKTKEHIIGLVTDTKYFSELLKSYNGCDILIINVPYYKNDKKNSKHMDITDVKKLIEKLNPKKVILTHFNRNILEVNPDLVVKELMEKYRIEVVAAKDNMVIEL